MRTKKNTKKDMPGWEMTPYKNLNEATTWEISQRVAMALVQSTSTSVFNILFGHAAPEIASPFLDVSGPANVLPSVMPWGGYDWLRILTKLKLEVPQHHHKKNEAIKIIDEAIEKIFRSIMINQAIVSLFSSAIILTSPSILHDDGLSAKNQNLLKTATWGAAANPLFTAMNAGTGLAVTALNNTPLNTKLTIVKSLSNTAMTIAIYTGTKNPIAIIVGKTAVDATMFALGLTAINHKHPELQLLEITRLNNIIPCRQLCSLFTKMLKSGLPQLTDSAIQIATIFTLASYGSKFTIALHLLTQSQRYLHSIIYAITNALKAVTTDPTFPKETIVPGQPNIISTEILNRIFGAYLSIFAGAATIGLAASYKQLFKIILSNSSPVVAEGMQIAYNNIGWAIAVIPCSAIGAFSGGQLKIKQQYLSAAALNLMGRGLSLLIGATLAESEDEGSYIIIAAFAGVMLSAILQLIYVSCCSKRCSSRLSSSHEMNTETAINKSATNLGMKEILNLKAIIPHRGKTYDETIEMGMSADHKDATRPADEKPPTRSYAQTFWDGTFGQLCPSRRAPTHTRRTPPIGVEEYKSPLNSIPVTAPEYKAKPKAKKHIKADLLTPLLQQKHACAGAPVGSTWSSRSTAFEDPESQSVGSRDYTPPTTPKP